MSRRGREREDMIKGSYGAIHPLILAALSSAVFPVLLARQTVKKERLPFQDPGLTVEERVADLVSRMTREEKISQLRYDAPAVEKLGIPEYNWWNECLHGVARAGIFSAGKGSTDSGSSSTMSSLLNLTARTTA